MRPNSPAIQWQQHHHQAEGVGIQRAAQPLQSSIVETTPEGVRDVQRASPLVMHHPTGSTSASLAPPIGKTEQERPSPPFRFRPVLLQNGRIASPGHPPVRPTSSVRRAAEPWRTRSERRRGRDRRDVETADPAKLRSRQTVETAKPARAVESSRMDVVLLALPCIYSSTGLLLALHSTIVATGTLLLSMTRIQET
jgi:hypothetical protein